jgi:hypothetical protein
MDCSCYRPVPPPAVVAFKADFPALDQLFQRALDLLRTDFATDVLIDVADGGLGVAPQVFQDPRGQAAQLRGRWRSEKSVTDRYRPAILTPGNIFSLPKGRLKIRFSIHF